MSEIKDDPREVLVLLNSLGFVGITAAQLKAFMKDLKIYRKIKDREKQQRKEEIKTKIISKQQAVIKEAYVQQNTDYSLNNIPSKFSNSLDDKAVVKLRIRCIPKEEDFQRQKHPEATVMSLDKRPSTKYKKDIQIAESDKIYFEQDRVKSKSCSNIRSCESKNRPNVSKYPVKSDHLTERCKYNLRIEEQEKSVTSTHEHPINEPILPNHVTRPRSKSAASDPTENVRVQSTLSARSSVNFTQKSFIRPWRLQPEAQKNFGNKKCDPVALYQKYQQEWKQISFPGEAKHSKLRWAVREKMLGADPHPLPLPKKSASMPILKRK